MTVPASSSGPEPSGNSASTQPRLLSVEDKAETRLLLKHGLEEDYEVVFAEGEEEAIEAARFGDFDALLLDINLTEEKGGIELLRCIRDREDMSGVPAIAVTAYAMPGDRQKLLREGFDAYVSKPFTLSGLRRTVQRVLKEEGAGTG